MDTGAEAGAGGCGPGVASQLLPSVARKPEFSQCFGDKAALEELTDGALRAFCFVNGVCPNHTLRARVNKGRVD